MLEILNQDEIREICKTAPVAEGHATLLEAFRSRYPNFEFRIAAKREGVSWAPGIIDRDGNRIADSLVRWVDQEIDAAGGSVQDVWRRHKDSGLIRTEYTGDALLISVPFGAEPDAFYQIEIWCGVETTKQLLFGPEAYFMPEDSQDLFTGPCMVFGESERETLSLPVYQFFEVVNIRHYLRELVEVEKANRLAELPELQKRTVRVHELDPDGSQYSAVIPFLDLCPNWVGRIPNAVRFFQDWQESSAGQSGARLCDHWWIQTNKYVNSRGEKNLYFCPRWADAGGGLELPVIEPKWEDSPYRVIDELLQFDRAAGYPFAWYFYMLHGNRISYVAGKLVAKAILDGVMSPLPEGDAKVLERWSCDSYGF